MEIIKIKSGDSTAEIYAYGATVTSWRVKNREKLFLSTKGKTYSIICYAAFLRDKTIKTQNLSL